jgi:hypothetical protein
MKEFSARNASEIRQASEQQSEELAAELRGVTIAVKANRIKWAQQDHDDTQRDLETETDSRERRGLRALASKLSRLDRLELPSEVLPGAATRTM